MSDELDYTEEPLNEPTLMMDRKVLLLILAGMAGLAVTLTVLRSRMAPQPTTLGSIPEGSSWEASLQHVCDTFDMRLAGIDARLDALANDKVQMAAQFSSPPVALTAQNGETVTVERVPPIVETGPVSDTPKPAAVSFPPE